MEQIAQPPESNKSLRRVLAGVAALGAIIALSYGICDWRAARAWERYRRDYETYVAPLDCPAFIPKQIPDADNFAATPFVQSWFNALSTNFVYDGDAYSKADSMRGGWSTKNPRRKMEDLVSWQQAFAAVRAGAERTKDRFPVEERDVASLAQAAPAVRSALQDDEAALAELASASTRSGCRYPISYDFADPWSTLLPHLAKVRETCVRLKLRASAEMAADQGQKALDDIKLSFYMEDTLKGEPFIISYLVRIACLQISVQPVWEGLQLHVWNEAQLKELQACLESYDFLADMQWPMHAERALGILAVDTLKKRGAGWLADLGTITDSSPIWAQNKVVLNTLGRLVPSGWYTLEKLNYCQAFDSIMKGVTSGASRRVIPGELITNQFGSFTVFQTMVHHQLIAAAMLPSFSRISTKAAMAQTATDEAATACALERYCLANGHFPEKLASLSPRFMDPLPHDIISGAALQYRLTSENNFVLYSVGWNEKDDGGVMGKTLFDDKQGDWVW